MTRFLAVLILSSFAVTLLPIASTSAESMPCCAGKSAEHCDSGLMAPKPRPVITEPMCGLPSPPAANEVKVVADPVAVKAVSVAPECQMDCGACATSTARIKRPNVLIHARGTYGVPSITTASFDNATSFHSSNESWTQINPRGPPARA